MDTAIETVGLVKQFGDKRALDGVDLKVPAGTVLSLLGPNGAGKTTVVRILATLTRPDGGRATVCGNDVVREADLVRRLIGLTGQYASVDENISGWENLYLVGRLTDLPRRRARARADELLEQFGLTAAAKQLPRSYSGGMRRKLDLAASLVGEPRVLYLDEPTTGLDPRSRNALWAAVRARVATGTTVLLTTQYMEEAEALADSVVVMDNGRVIEAGTTDQLRARVGGKVLHIRPTRAADLAQVLRALAGAGLAGASLDAGAGLVRMPIAGDAELTTAVGALASSALPIAGIDTHVPSLDEVFLSLTGAQPAGSGDAAQVRA
ncbi:ATP-binding cassette domain-containing protein [Kutzneria viridogrisea]|uniref:Oleandomycin transport system ATP-binding protein n=1 Tax=Kutzneria viridogrisea TaxID=47990 RepID=A0ABR6BPL3_9PSEU|nr:oleandomycin transport system ATP-binding protein [Kutzneria viridogrisea]